MADFSKPERWLRWAGSPSLVADAAQMAHDTLAEWTNEPPAFLLDVQEEDQEFRSRDIADLELLRTRKPNRIKHIIVLIGDLVDQPRVELHAHGLRAMSAVPALELRVVRDDETTARGLAGQLRELLNDGQQWPGWYSRARLVPAVLLIWLGLSLAGLITVDRASDVPFWFVASVLALLVIGSALWILTPNLELLGPGERSRFRRFRGWFIATLLALLIGVAASAIWDLFGDDEEADRPQPNEQRDES